MEDKHALMRASDRIAPTISPETFRAIQHRAIAYAESHPRDRHAVRVHCGDTFHGTPWGAESNGQDIWAIVDNGTIRTYMFRRHNQPRDKRAFNVQYIALED